MLLNKEDFIVLGNNPVTVACQSGSVIDLFKENRYTHGYVSFVASDDFETYRHIGFKNTKKDVFNAYGKSYVKKFDRIKDRIYLYGQNQQDMECIQSFVEYAYREYILRIYFDECNNIQFVVYIKNYEKIKEV